MKRKYSISFFMGILSLILLLTGAYYMNYQKAVQKHELALEEIRKEEKIIATDGTATKETGYYLRERNGFVIVYLHDEKTLYTDTNITIESLPKQWQEEIKMGKYIENTEALYGFLENYSS